MGETEVNLAYENFFVCSDLCRYKKGLKSMLVRLKEFPEDLSFFMDWYTTFLLNSLLGTILFIFETSGEQLKSVRLFYKRDGILSLAVELSIDF